MYPGTRSRQRENASNHAVELRLLAERKAGEALKGLERGRNQYDSGSAADTLSGASEYQQALEESGVSERQAQRWQEAARIDEEDLWDSIISLTFLKKMCYLCL